MRAWALLLGGLIVWTVHFFTLYTIGSIFLTTPLARLLTILVTAACLIADLLLLFRRAAHHAVVFNRPESSCMRKPDLVQEIGTGAVLEHTIMKCIIQVEGFCSGCFFCRCCRLRDRR